MKLNIIGQRAALSAALYAAPPTWLAEAESDPGLQVPQPLHHVGQLLLLLGGGDGDQVTSAAPAEGASLGPGARRPRQVVHQPAGVGPNRGRRQGCRGHQVVVVAGMGVWTAVEIVALLYGQLIQIYG